MNNIKNPIFFWLLVIFTGLNIVDIATAVFVLPGESNPLFLIFKTLWVVIALKVLVLSILWTYCLRNIFPSNTIYFIFLLLVLLGISVTGLAIKSNITALMNPELVELSNQISSGEKMQLYFDFVIFSFMIPFLFSVLAFWFYDKSNKNIKVDKEYYKKRNWWKI